MILPEFAGSRAAVGRATQVRRRPHRRQGHRPGRRRPSTTSSPAYDLTSPGHDPRARGPGGTWPASSSSGGSLDAGPQPDGLRDRVQGGPQAARRAASPRGFAVHGLGYPLDLKTFGGWFLYSMGGDQRLPGPAGLPRGGRSDDGLPRAPAAPEDPPLPPSSACEGAEVVKYGAKTVTIGGWSSVPQLHTDGAMIVGDSRQLPQPLPHQGHPPVDEVGDVGRGGRLRRDVLNGEAHRRRPAQGLQADGVESELDARTELEKSARTSTPTYAGGLISGSVKFGMAVPVRLPGLHPQADQALRRRPRPHAEAARPVLRESGPQLEEPRSSTTAPTSKSKLDGRLPVGHHARRAPAGAPQDRRHGDLRDHLSSEEYGNPCTQASVRRRSTTWSRTRSPVGLEMRVDFSNCVHCKTCDIRDPYQIITWVPPRGGDGPEWAIM